MVLNPDHKIGKIKRRIYLKDIFIISISAFGGAGAHLSSLLKRLVHEKKYLSEKEFFEIYSFCQMLPGPTSTETITAIGMKLGGHRLALYTLLLWIFPATLIMTSIVLLLNFYDSKGADLSFTRLLQPMAVAYIFKAAIDLLQNFKSDSLYKKLFIASATLAVAFKNPLIFPIILGLAGYISFKKRDFVPSHNPNPVKIKWKNLILFFSLFILAALAGFLIKAQLGKDANEAIPVLLFENNYRFGTLVFGGGNVLIPMMFEQFVRFKQYLSPQEFILGVGINQALPGPVFSVATYMGGMILKDWGWIWQVLGCIIASIGIYTPGLLFIYFLFPIWDYFKNTSWINKSMPGISAASAGLVLSGAILLMVPTIFDVKGLDNLHLFTIINEWSFVIHNYSFDVINFLFIIISYLIIRYTKIAPTLMVVLTTLLGFLINFDWII